MKYSKCERVRIRLASIPNFADKEYHHDQIKFYAKMTELIYKALIMNSIRSFINEVIRCLNIKEDIELRVMRLPSRRSRVIGINERGRIVGRQIYGRAWRNKPLIDIFPNLIFLELSCPSYNVRFRLRRIILNSVIRGVIHEILHKSGLKDENETKKVTEEYYETFRKRYLKQFDKEIKPLLREWYEFEVAMIR